MNTKIDKSFLDFVETETQRRIVEAVIEHGSHRKAAKALNVGHSSVDQAIMRIRKIAARQGYAPGHWESGVAPGYEMGKVTIQRRNEDGTFRWERQHPELEELKLKLEAAVEAAKEQIPPAALQKLHNPKGIRYDLCTQYTVTDYHIGMQAHAHESDGTGDDWNLEIAEEMLVSAITHLANKAPASGLGLLCLLGDLAHFDGPDAVTPTHRHPLDAAARQRAMVKVIVRAIRRVIQVMLLKHKQVRVMVVEGNHDLSSTPWLREILLVHYENNPRVEIIDNDLPYQATEFGVNFIGLHHGHKKKKENLPILFAALFREIWGRTKKGIINTGHYHESNEKDHPGVRVVQHSTLAAPDSHSTRGGWVTNREMVTIHYHEKHGPIGRDIVTPEMLKAA